MMFIKFMTLPLLIGVNSCRYLVVERWIFILVNSKAEETERERNGVRVVGMEGRNMTTKRQ